jgi:hypothetical protein
MSVSEAESKPRLDTFGLPNRDFLRLTAEILETLELESHSRGNRMLASLLDIARTEAEDGLKAPPKQHACEEAEPWSGAGRIGAESSG